MLNENVLDKELAEQNFQWEFVEHKYCPICNSISFKVYHSEYRRGVPLQFVVCNNCGVVLQNPHPTNDCLRRFFSSSLFIGQQGNQPENDDIGYYDYSAWENCYRKNAKPIISLLSKLKPSSAKLLEIGGATGWFLYSAKEAGYEAEGLDISNTLAELVRKRYNMNVTLGSIEGANFPDESFDVICNFGGIGCWYDPHTALNNVNRILKGGGIFCFNYPNYKSIVAKIRGEKYFEFNHASLFIYDSAAIRNLLKVHSFHIISESIQHQYTSLGRIFSYLKYNKLYSLANKLRLNGIIIKVPVISTKIVLAKKV